MNVFQFAPLEVDLTDLQNTLVGRFAEKRSAQLWEKIKLI